MWIVLLALALLIAVGCSMPGDNCLPIGCENVAAGIVDVPLAREALDGARLDVCRNGMCAHAEVIVRSTDGELICSSTGRTSGRGKARCDPLVETLETGVRVRVRYTADRAERFEDGDVFTVRFTDASAKTTLAQRSGTVASYRVWSPSGNDCEVGVECREGSF